MFSILMLFYDVVKTEIRLLIQKVFQSVLVSYLPMTVKGKKEIEMSIHRHIFKPFQSGCIASSRAIPNFYIICSGNQTKL